MKKIEQQAGATLSVFPNFRPTLLQREHVFINSGVFEIDKIDGVFYPKANWRPISPSEFAVLTGRSPEQDAQRDRGALAADGGPLISLLELPRHLRERWWSVAEQLLEDLCAASETESPEGRGFFQAVVEFLQFKRIPLSASCTIEILVRQPGLKSSILYPSGFPGRAVQAGEIKAPAECPFFATGKSFTVDGLREKLREFFRQEVRPELRAVAALNNVELITALISFNCQLGLLGLQVRILNGVVSLLNYPGLKNKELAAYASEQNGANGSLGFTAATLEVLACIAFKQPISQAEIDRLFDADKRGLVVKLRDLKLVEEFAGADGRLRFATTKEFLQRFGLASLQELNAASLSDKATSDRTVDMSELLTRRPLGVFQ